MFLQDSSEVVEEVLVERLVFGVIGLNEGRVETSNFFRLLWQVDGFAYEQKVNSENYATKSVRIDKPLYFILTFLGKGS